MIYLRGADRGDCGELAQLRAASLLELELLEPAAVGPFTAQARRAFEALFAAGQIAAWIACDDERIVASCSAVFYDRLPYPEGSRHAELGGVYVLPAYRKRGLASELVREVVAAAQGAGARKTFLRPSKAGRAIYARLGFVGTELMTFDCRLASQRDERLYPAGVSEPPSGVPVAYE